MTDDRFKELVNLYLDKEISVDDLEHLKQELASNPDRKKVFVERCRLHQAMRIALDTDGSGRSNRSTLSGRRRRSQGATKMSRLEEQVRSRKTVPFPRWVLGTGVMASLLVALLLLTGVFRGGRVYSGIPERVGISESPSTSQAHDPLEVIRQSDLRRFATAQEQRGMKMHASLVAQMRLLGLRPEHTPEDKQLQEVNMAAIQPREQSISQAELFQRIQRLKAMPDPQVLNTEAVGSSVWADSLDGFSLVSFEN